MKSHDFPFIIERSKNINDNQSTRLLCKPLRNIRDIHNCMVMNDVITTFRLKGVNLIPPYGGLRGPITLI